MPLPPRYAEGTENSFLETAFRKTSFMEHYPILQKQLLFGSSSCFGSLEQNVFVLLNDKSRMKGDFHVRVREKFEVKVLLPTRFYLPVVNVFIKLRAIFNSLHIRVTTSDNMSAQVKLNGTTTIYHFKRCDISGTEDIK